MDAQGRMDEKHIASFYPFHLVFSPFSSLQRVYLLGLRTRHFMQLAVDACKRHTVASTSSLAPDASLPVQQGAYEAEADTEQTQMQPTNDRLRSRLLIISGITATHTHTSLPPLSCAIRSGWPLIARRVAADRVCVCVCLCPRPMHGVLVCGGANRFSLRTSPSAISPVEEGVWSGVSVR